MREPVRQREMFAWTLAVTFAALAMLQFLSQNGVDARLRAWSSGTSDGECPRCAGRPSAWHREGWKDIPTVEPDKPTGCYCLTCGYPLPRDVCGDLAEELWHPPPQ